MSNSALLFNTVLELLNECRRSPLLNQLYEKENKLYNETNTKYFVKFYSVLQVLGSQFCDFPFYV